jgi:hypothetical protein
MFVMKQQHAKSRHRLMIFVASLVLILCALCAPFVLRVGNEKLRDFVDWLFLMFLQAIS